MLFYLRFYGYMAINDPVRARGRAGLQGASGGAALFLPNTFYKREIWHGGEPFLQADVDLSAVFRAAFIRL